MVGITYLVNYFAGAFVNLDEATLGWFTLTARNARIVSGALDGLKLPVTVVEGSESVVKLVTAFVRNKSVRKPHLTINLFDVRLLVRLKSLSEQQENGLTVDGNALSPEDITRLLEQKTAAIETAMKARFRQRLMQFGLSRGGLGSGLANLVRNLEVYVDKIHVQFVYGDQHLSSRGASVPDPAPSEGFVPDVGSSVPASTDTPATEDEPSRTDSGSRDGHAPFVLGLAVRRVDWHPIRHGVFEHASAPELPAAQGFKDVAEVFDHHIARFADLFVYLNPGTLSDLRSDSPGSNGGSDADLPDSKQSPAAGGASAATSDAATGVTADEEKGLSREMPDFDFERARTGRVGSSLAKEMEWVGVPYDKLQVILQPQGGAVKVIKYEGRVLDLRDPPRLSIDIQTDGVDFFIHELQFVHLMSVYEYVTAYSAIEERRRDLHERQMRESAGEADDERVLQRDQYIALYKLVFAGEHFIAEPTAREFHADDLLVSVTGEVLARETVSATAAVRRSDGMGEPSTGPTHDSQHYKVVAARAWLEALFRRSDDSHHARHLLDSADDGWIPFIELAATTIAKENGWSAPVLFDAATPSTFVAVRGEKLHVGLDGSEVSLSDAELELAGRVHIPSQAAGKPQLIKAVWLQGEAAAHHVHERKAFAEKLQAWETALSVEEAVRYRTLAEVEVLTEYWLLEDAKRKQQAISDFVHGVESERRSHSYHHRHHVPGQRFARSWFSHLRHHSKAHGHDHFHRSCVIDQGHKLHSGHRHSFFWTPADGDAVSHDGPWRTSLTTEEKHELYNIDFDTKLSLHEDEIVNLPRGYARFGLRAHLGEVVAAVVDESREPMMELTLTDVTGRLRLSVFDVLEGELFVQGIRFVDWLAPHGDVPSMRDVHSRLRHILHFRPRLLNVPAMDNSATDRLQKLYDTPLESHFSGVAGVGAGSIADAGRSRASSSGAESVGSTPDDERSLRRLVGAPDMMEILRSEELSLYLLKYLRDHGHIDQVERMLFWRACEAYRQIGDSERKSAQLAIFEAFASSTSNALREITFAIQQAQFSLTRDKVPGPLYFAERGRNWQLIVFEWLCDEVHEDFLRQNWCPRHRCFVQQCELMQRDCRWCPTHDQARRECESDSLPCYDEPHVPPPPPELSVSFTIRQVPDRALDRHSGHDDYRRNRRHRATSDRPVASAPLRSRRRVSLTSLPTLDAGAEEAKERDLAVVNEDYELSDSDSSVTTVYTSGEEAIWDYGVAGETADDAAIRAARARHSHHATELDGETEPLTLAEVADALDFADSDDQETVSQSDDDDEGVSPLKAKLKRKMMGLHLPKKLGGAGPDDSVSDSDGVRRGGARDWQYDSVMSMGISSWPASKQVSSSGEKLGLTSGGGDRKPNRRRFARRSTSSDATDEAGGLEGEWIKKGFLHKRDQHRNRWRKLFFVLPASRVALLYYKNEGDRVPLGAVPLSPALQIVQGSESELKDFARMRQFTRAGFCLLEPRSGQMASTHRGPGAVEVPGIGAAQPRRPAAIGGAGAAASDTLARDSPPHSGAAPHTLRHTLRHPVATPLPGTPATDRLSTAEHAVFVFASNADEMRDWIDAVASAVAENARREDSIAKQLLASHRTASTTALRPYSAHGAYHNPLSSGPWIRRLGGSGMVAKAATASAKGMSVGGIAVRRDADAVGTEATPPLPADHRVQDGKGWLVEESRREREARTTFVGAVADFVVVVHPDLLSRVINFASRNESTFLPVRAHVIADFLDAAAAGDLDRLDAATTAVAAAHDGGLQGRRQALLSVSDSDGLTALHLICRRRNGGLSSKGWLGCLVLLLRKVGHHAEYCNARTKAGDTALQMLLEHKPHEADFCAAAAVALLCHGATSASVRTAPYSDDTAESLLALLAAADERSLNSTVRSLAEQKVRDGEDAKPPWSVVLGLPLVAAAASGSGGAAVAAAAADASDSPSDAEETSREALGAALSSRQQMRLNVEFSSVSVVIPLIEAAAVNDEASAPAAPEDSEYKRKAREAREDIVNREKAIGASVPSMPAPAPQRSSVPTGAIGAIRFARQLRKRSHRSETLARRRSTGTTGAGIFGESTEYDSTIIVAQIDVDKAVMRTAMRRGSDASMTDTARSVPMPVFSSTSLSDERTHVHTLAADRCLHSADAVAPLGVSLAELPYYDNLRTLVSGLRMRLYEIGTHRRLPSLVPSAGSESDYRSPEGPHSAVEYKVGVNSQPFGLLLESAYGNVTRVGAQVARVRPSSPIAATGKVQPGDVLLVINGQNVSDLPADQVIALVGKAELQVAQGALAGCTFTFRGKRRRRIVTPAAQRALESSERSKLSSAGAEVLKKDDTDGLRKAAGTVVSSPDEWAQGLRVAWCSHVLERANCVIAQFVCRVVDDPKLPTTATRFAVSAVRLRLGPHALRVVARYVNAWEGAYVPLLRTRTARSSKASALREENTVITAETTQRRLHPLGARESRRKMDAAMLISADALELAFMRSAEISGGGSDIPPHSMDENVEVGSVCFDRVVLSMASDLNTATAGAGHTRVDFSQVRVLRLERNIVNRFHGVVRAESAAAEVEDSEAAPLLQFDSQLSSNHLVSPCALSIVHSVSPSRTLAESDVAPVVADSVSPCTVRDVRLKAHLARVKIDGDMEYIMSLTAVAVQVAEEYEAELGSDSSESGEPARSASAEAGGEVPQTQSTVSVEGEPHLMVIDVGIDGIDCQVCTPNSARADLVPLLRFSVSKVDACWAPGATALKGSESTPLSEAPESSVQLSLQGFCAVPMLVRDHGGVGATDGDANWSGERHGVAKLEFDSVTVGLSLGYAIPHDTLPPMAPVTHVSILFAPLSLTVEGTSVRPRGGRVNTGLRYVGSTPTSVVREVVSIRHSGTRQGPSVVYHAHKPSSRAKASCDEQWNVDIAAVNVAACPLCLHTLNLYWEHANAALRAARDLLVTQPVGLGPVSGIGGVARDDSGETEPSATPTARITSSASREPASVSMPLLDVTTHVQIDAELVSLFLFGVRNRGVDVTAAADASDGADTFLCSEITVRQLRTELLITSHPAENGASAWSEWTVFSRGNVLTVSDETASRGGVSSDILTPATETRRHGPSPAWSRGARKIRAARRATMASVSPKSSSKDPGRAAPDGIGNVADAPDRHESSAAPGGTGVAPSARPKRSMSVADAHSARSRGPMITLKLKYGQPPPTDLLEPREDGAGTHRDNPLSTKRSRVSQRAIKYAQHADTYNIKVVDAEYTHLARFVKELTLSFHTVLAALYGKDVWHASTRTGPPSFMRLHVTLERIVLRFPRESGVQPGAPPDSCPGSCEQVMLTLQQATVRNDLQEVERASLAPDVARSGGGPSIAVASPHRSVAVGTFDPVLDFVSPPGGDRARRSATSLGLDADQPMLYNRYTIAASRAAMQVGRLDGGGRVEESPSLVEFPAIEVNYDEPMHRVFALAAQRQMEVRLEMPDGVQAELSELQLDALQHILLSNLNEHSPRVQEPPHLQGKVVMRYRIASSRPVHAIVTKDAVVALRQSRLDRGNLSNESRRGGRLSSGNVGTSSLPSVGISGSSAPAGATIGSSKPTDHPFAAAQCAEPMSHAAALAVPRDVAAESGSDAGEASTAARTHGAAVRSAESLPLSAAAVIELHEVASMVPAPTAGPRAEAGVAEAATADGQQAKSIASSMHAVRERPAPIDLNSASLRLEAVEPAVSPTRSTVYSVLRAASAKLLEISDKTLPAPAAAADHRHRRRYRRNTTHARSHSSVSADAGGVIERSRKHGTHALNEEAALLRKDLIRLQGQARAIAEVLLSTGTAVDSHDKRRKAELAGLAENSSLLSQLLVMMQSSNVTRAATMSIGAGQLQSTSMDGLDVTSGSDSSTSKLASWGADTSES